MASHPTPFRPPLGLAMTIAQLVANHTEAAAAARRFDEAGYDHAAQDADEYARGISVELRERLQSFVGAVLLDDVVGAL